MNSTPAAVICINPSMLSFPVRCWGMMVSNAELKSVNIIIVSVCQNEEVRWCVVALSVEWLGWCTNCRESMVGGSKDLMFLMTSFVETLDVDKCYETTVLEAWLWWLFCMGTIVVIFKHVGITVLLKKLTVLVITSGSWSANSLSTLKIVTVTEIHKCYQSVCIKLSTI